jgi:hypothetical protein
MQHNCKGAQGYDKTSMVVVFSHSFPVFPYYTEKIKLEWTGFTAQKI